MRLMPFSYFWICWNVRPELLAELLLAHAEQHAAKADPAADVHIDGIWPSRALLVAVAPVDETGCSRHDSPVRVALDATIGRCRRELPSTSGAVPIRCQDSVRYARYGKLTACIYEALAPRWPAATGGADQPEHEKDRISQPRIGRRRQCHRQRHVDRPAGVRDRAARGCGRSRRWLPKCRCWPRAPAAGPPRRRARAPDAGAGAGPSYCRTSRRW